MCAHGDVLVRTGARTWIDSAQYATLAPDSALGHLLLTARNCEHWNGRQPGWGGGLMCNLEWFIQVRERLQDGLVLEARRVAVARIL